MNYQNLPDAPESVKHWSGYDPADPPHDSEYDEIFSEICPKCDDRMNPDEMGKDGLCCNCTVDNPENLEWKAQHQLTWPFLPPLPVRQVKEPPIPLYPEQHGLVMVLNEFNRRFGFINPDHTR